MLPSKLLTSEKVTAEKLDVGSQLDNILGGEDVVQGYVWTTCEACSLDIEKPHLRIVKSQATELFLMVDCYLGVYQSLPVILTQGCTITFKQRKWVRSCILLGKDFEVGCPGCGAVICHPSKVLSNLVHSCFWVGQNSVE